jgi:hypothetical protein
MVRHSPSSVPRDFGVNLQFSLNDHRTFYTVAVKMTRGRGSKLMNTTRFILIAVLINSTAILAAQQAAPRPTPTNAWALKPLKTPGYRPGLRPWVKLAEVKKNTRRVRTGPRSSLTMGA